MTLRAVAPVSISGTALVGGTPNGVLYLDNSGFLSSGSALTFDGTTFSLGSGGSGTIATVLSINATDNAGQGGYILGKRNGSNAWYIGDTAGALGSGTGLISYNYGTAPWIWYLQTGGEQMRLTSTGLGIGTSSPGAKLHIKQNSGDGFGSGLRLTNASSSNYWDFVEGADNSLYTGYNGAVRTVIDASGNLGIGTSSPGEKLTVAATANNAAKFTSTATTTALVIDNTNANGWGSNVAIKTGGVAAGYFGTIGSLLGSTTQDLAVYATAGNAFRIYTDGNNLRATFDYSGNLGLGVTPYAWSSFRSFDFESGGAIASYTTGGMAFTQNAYFTTTWKYKSTAAAAKFNIDAGAYSWNIAPSGTAGASITFTQAMTLDASGNLFVGRTAQIGTARFSIQKTGGNNNTIAAYQPDAGGYNYVSDAYNNGNTYYHAQFSEQGVARGSITSNGSAVAYNTSSDYRLKNITGPITTSGQYIDSLKPVEGAWKADGSTFVGLIAHEVQEVSRTQVATGEKDGAEMQAMDYSSAEIIANLIAELQDVRKRLAALEAK